ncbi:hypothetical protein [Actinophytocola sediminis]
MDVLLPFLLLAAGFGVVVFGLSRLAVRARRNGVSGVGSSSMTIIDEIFHPIAHEARQEIQEFEERVAGKELPGDPPDAQDRPVQPEISMASMPRRRID